MGQERSCSPIKMLYRLDETLYRNYVAFSRCLLHEILGGRVIMLQRYVRNLIIHASLYFPCFISQTYRLRTDREGIHECISFQGSLSQFRARLPAAAEADQSNHTLPHGNWVKFLVLELRLKARGKRSLTRMREEENLDIRM